MTVPSYIAQVAGTVTQNNISVTLPATVQGGDLILFLESTRDPTLIPPSGGGYVAANAQTIGDLYGGVYYKFAAGTVGSGSSDASTTVTWTVAVTGSGHKNALTCIIIRGVNPSAPINDVQFVAPATGGTTFTGPSAASDIDDVLVVSCFIDKDSSNPLNITAPSGYTKRSEALFTTGSGKANASIATKNGGAAGNYGADTWTTDAIPGTVGTWTVLLAPVSSTQTIRPMGDVGTPTGVTGVSNNTAGQLYQNVDDSTLNTADWDEFIVTGDITHSLTSLSSPGVNTGFSYVSVFGLGAGVTSASYTVTLKQSTTTIESWSVTVTSDGQVDTHALNPTNIANIVYTSGAAANLRIEYVLTAAS